MNQDTPADIRSGTLGYLGLKRGRHLEMNPLYREVIVGVYMASAIEVAWSM